MKIVKLGNRIITEKNETDKLFLDEIRKVFESCNINFLIGSGFSSGILKTLGNVELILEHVQKKDDVKSKIIEALTYWRFFKESIFPVNELSHNTGNLDQHNDFTKVLNNLIEKRGNTTNSKRLNVFTTNYDPVLELAFENNNLVYNDGFNGRIFPIYCTSNFNRTYYNQTMFTDKLVEIPVFNLVKMHGSMTWGKDVKNERYIYQNMNTCINPFYEEHGKLFEPLVKIQKDIISLVSIEDEIVDVIEQHSSILDALPVDKYNEFISEYKTNFEIINPTKEKFNETVFNKTYHELLRIYSNELEKMNSALLVFGFSFKDEHIHEITRRALGNPTLKIYIFAYRTKHIEMYEEKFSSNNNVTVVAYEGSDIDEDKREESAVIDLSFFTQFLGQV